METSKKIAIGAVASIALVTGLLVRFGALASGGEGVNVSMPVAKTLQVFLGGSQAGSLNVGTEEGTVRLGSASGDTTVFTAVSTTEDIGVGRNLVVLGTTQVNGATQLNGTLQVAGTSTLNGVIVSNNLPARTVVTMSTATTTPCAVQNTSGADRTLVAVSVNETAYAGAGTVGLTVGTSTTAFVTPTSPLISNTLFANSASQNVISTTSTLMSAYANWKNGEWLVFKTTTSTNAGSCVALSM